MENSLHRPLISSFSLFLSFIFQQTAFSQSTVLKSLIPEQVEIQYAGSIGYTSMGIGYNLFRKKTVLSFHYGYVPEIKGGELHIVAVKFSYKPFSIPIGDKFIIYPLNPVFFLSYTIGKNFALKFDDNQYTKDYYFWSPALREHLGLSSALEILGDQSSKIKSISLYTEVNTNDLYMISWYANRTTIPIYKIFHLGFGIRMNF